MVRLSPLNCWILISPRISKLPITFWSTLGHLLATSWSPLCDPLANSWPPLGLLESSPSWPFPSPAVPESSPFPSRQPSLPQSSSRENVLSPTGISRRDFGLWHSFDGICDFNPIFMMPLPFIICCLVSLQKTQWIKTFTEAIASNRSDRWRQTAKVSFQSFARFRVWNIQKKCWPSANMHSTCWFWWTKTFFLRLSPTNQRVEEMQSRQSTAEQKIHLALTGSIYHTRCRAHPQSVFTWKSYACRMNPLL